MNTFYVKKFFSTSRVSLFNYSNAENPRVFLDLSKDGKPLGKMVFEVIKMKVINNVKLIVI